MDSFRVMDSFQLIKEAHEKTKHLPAENEPIKRAFQWLIDEVDRLRRIEDAAIPWYDCKEAKDYPALTAELKHQIGANCRDDGDG